MPKKITIDDLAAMIKKGFDQIDNRFDNNDKNHARFEKQLTIHDFKMAEMVHKADYYQLEERVEKLENKIGIK